MKNTYYKVCGKCGAHLDPGEKCSCATDHQPAANYIERVLEGLASVWARDPRLDRRAIEAAAVGRVVTGIYPTYDTDAAGRERVTGFALTLCDINTFALSTLEFDIADDATLVLTETKGEIWPEDVMHQIERAVK